MMNTLPDNNRITVVGIGYVGLAISVLLARSNDVTAIDIIPGKIDSINNLIPVFPDEYISKYMEEAKAGKIRCIFMPLPICLSAESLTILS